MPDRAWSRLLRDPTLVQGMDSVAAALGSAWAVLDESGSLLAGQVGAAAVPRVPVTLDGQQVAWLAAPAHAAALAAALAGFVALEREKKSVAVEALDKYREINLLFHIHEVIGSTLDLAQVTRGLVAAARRLAPCEHCLLMLLSNDASELVTVEGDTPRHRSRLRRDEGIAGKAFATGRADVINEVKAAPDFAGETDFDSLMVAPIKIADRDLGVLVMGAKDGVSFTANDLKMLVTLASHGAIVIENVKLYDELRELFLATVSALAEAIEKRDSYTGGHTQRVMNYALMIAETLGITGKDYEDLRLSAMLHDVGKIGVPDAILQKPTRLDREEYEIMKRHTEHGFDILNCSRHLRATVDGVRFHHEHYGGGGYTPGLSGDQIPLVARIIAIVDAFDAMTTDRPYRKGMSFAAAAAELRKAAGTQFDPMLVKTFLDGMRKRHGMEL